MFKRSHRTQTKILLLILALGLVFAVGLGYELREQLRLERQMLSERQAEKAALVNDIIAQRTVSLRAFTQDYSRWDDMVKFATAPTTDSQFAVENFDIAAPNYQVQAIAVLNSRCELIYATAGMQKRLASDSAIGEICGLHLEAQPFNHFFVPQPGGVLELATAPIQPTRDADRKTMAQGYFLAGYLWSDSLLRWLSERTGTVTTLKPFEGETQTARPTALGENGTIISRQILYSVDETPIAVLENRYESNVFSEHLALVRRQVAGLALFGAFVIIVLFFFLRAWVTRPLEMIGSSLTQESSEPLLGMAGQEDEFGQIARLMHSFFEQRIALVEEIVERTHAERHAHESQRALRSFVANLAGMAYRCRHDANRSAEYISDGCQAITGFPAHRFTDDGYTVTLNAMIHPDDRELIRNAIDDAVTKRQPYKLNYRLVTADHEERFVLDQGRAVRSSADSSIVLEGIIVDITDRVRAENDRAALQTKLNRAERVQALGLLAGGVAHDLNNMLAPVLNYPELILMRLPDDDPLRPKINIIRDAAQQAVDVVQDLLTMARRGRYEMAPVDLNAVVERYLNSANFLQLTAKHPAVTVDVRLGASLDIITGSPTHLHKAIMNIVVNAFDAMPQGGTLTITTEERIVSSLADGHLIIPGDYVILSVRDTGTGIAPEDLKRIFEPYFSRKKMGTSGTGLGLAVVYGTIKDHHGYYDIESIVGAGTTFMLYFPSNRQQCQREVMGDDSGEQIKTASRNAE